MVDHRGGLDDPGIFLARGGVGAFLRAEHRRLFLGLADEEYAFRAGAAGAVGSRDVVLALVFVKGDEVHALLLDERFDLADEGGADRFHERRGGKGAAPMVAEERRDAGSRLQFGLINIEVHAVNALNFEGHMLGDDVGNAAWYTHGWLRSSWPSWPINRQAV